MPKLSDAFFGSGGDGGLFGFAMGHPETHDPSDEQLAALFAVEEAEYSFETAMAHLARTKIKPTEAQDVLQSILASWRCLERARTAAGF